MAYDETLTARFRNATAGIKGITEKKMMGGICFLHQGNMIGGADKGRFMFLTMKRTLARHRLKRLKTPKNQQSWRNVPMSSHRLGFASSLPTKACLSW
ncbi:TfoX/Sxy family protein [Grimontia hollisae]|uniref:TfoX/Sxy family protein n=1 Tax=Grimontia hollisae TaxID=673 RepID=UPI001CB6D53E|nr:TfoX/Sxy family protein [Grimontia hollisae]